MTSVSCGARTQPVREGETFCAALAISDVPPKTARLCPQAGPGPLPAGTTGHVIAYPEAQTGKLYQWGATGPDAFDCSGLTMMA
jgi:cell wall-associated NlpC family hydrolase